MSQQTSRSMKKSCKKVRIRIRSEEQCPARPYSDSRGVVAPSRLSDEQRLRSWELSCRVLCLPSENRLDYYTRQLSHKRSRSGRNVSIPLNTRIRHPSYITYAERKSSPWIIGTGKDIHDGWTCLFAWCARIYDAGDVWVSRPWHVNRSNGVDDDDCVATNRRNALNLITMSCKT